MTINEYIEQNNPPHTLKYLDLSNSKITSLKGIEYFNNLTELYLDNNNITDLRPLGACPFIEALSLRNNRIKSTYYLSFIDELRSLDISYNPIEKFEGIENICHLSIILLDSTKIRNIDFLYNKKYYHLSMLDLDLLISSLKKLNVYTLAVNKEMIFDNLEESKKYIEDSKIDNIQIDNTNYSISRMINVLKKEIRKKDARLILNNINNKY